jgi:hypothetical protein
MVSFDRMPYPFTIRPFEDASANHPPRVSRRRSAATMLPTSTAGAAQGQDPAARWALGCHTRPFGTFRASQAANPDYIPDAVKGAGYEFADMIAAGSLPAAIRRLRGVGRSAGGSNGRGAAATWKRSPS